MVEYMRIEAPGTIRVGDSFEDSAEPLILRNEAFDRRVICWSNTKELSGICSKGMVVDVLHWLNGGDQVVRARICRGCRWRCVSTV